MRYDMSRRLSPVLWQLRIMYKSMCVVAYIAIQWQLIAEFDIWHRCVSETSSKIKKTLNYVGKTCIKYGWKVGESSSAQAQSLPFFSQQVGLFWVGLPSWPSRFGFLLYFSFDLSGKLASSSQFAELVVINFTQVREGGKMHNARPRFKCE